MSIPFKSPAYLASSFNCPICNAFAAQIWYDVYYTNAQTHGFSRVKDANICYCSFCEGLSIWVGGKMILPSSGNVPVPNMDLPESVVELYDEARNVLNSSPRSAAALLRLGIEKLLEHILASGKSINHDISKLVKEGLSPKLQKALDILRVVGNNAVHAGTIDINDNPEIASRLFVLINVIADDMITKPREIDELYNSLPESDRLTIEKRDAK